MRLWRGGWLDAKAAWSLPATRSNNARRHARAAFGHLATHPSGEPCKLDQAKYSWTFPKTNERSPEVSRLNDADIPDGELRATAHIQTPS